MATKKVCAVTGCDKPAATRGWCSAHYYRWKRYGDPEAGDCSQGALPRWLAEHQSYAGEECLTWPFGGYGNGYGGVRVNGSVMTASRAMCLLAHGEPPTTKHQAMHSCGRGQEGCVNPRHLRWGTIAENHADMVAHGTSTRGVKNAMARLTEEKVREIRQMLSAGRSQRKIAKVFGIHQVTVSQIKRRLLWGWLDAEI